eukprot:PhF_6_TR42854/c0_g1_i2/m.64910
MQNNNKLAIASSLAIGALGGVLFMRWYQRRHRDDESEKPFSAESVVAQEINADGTKPKKWRRQTAAAPRTTVREPVSVVEDDEDEIIELERQPQPQQHGSINAGRAYRTFEDDMMDYRNDIQLFDTKGEEYIYEEDGQEDGGPYGEEDMDDFLEEQLKNHMIQEMMRGAYGGGDDDDEDYYDDDDYEGDVYPHHQIKRGGPSGADEEALRALAEQFMRIAAQDRGR